MLLRRLFIGVRDSGRLWSAMPPFWPSTRTLVRWQPTTLERRTACHRDQSSGTSAPSETAATHPRLDLFDLRSQGDARGGTLTRLTYDSQSQSVIMSLYPQTDQQRTTDPTPKIDFSRRATTRLSPCEVASTLALLEGKLSAQSHSLTIVRDTHTLSLSFRGDAGVGSSVSASTTDKRILVVDAAPTTAAANWQGDGAVFSGSGARYVTASQSRVPIHVEIPASSPKIVQLRCFLEAALIKSFNFRGDS